MENHAWLTLSDLDRTFAGRRPLIRKLVTVFIQTYDGFPTRMQALADQQDTTTFERELHSLKGASASLGAEALRARAAEIEAAVKSGDASPADAVTRLVSFWPAVMQNAQDILTALGD